jgi:hypothetical protein
MARTRHNNRLLVGQVVYVKANHLLQCITFDNGGLGSILVATVVLQYSHVPLEGIHVMEKHKATIVYLTHKVYNEMDNDIKERRRKKHLKLAYRLHHLFLQII